MAIPLLAIATLTLVQLIIRIIILVYFSLILLFFLAVDFMSFSSFHLNYTVQFYCSITL